MSDEGRVMLMDDFDPTFAASIAREAAASRPSARIAALAAPLDKPDPGRLVRIALALACGALVAAPWLWIFWPVKH